VPRVEKPAKHGGGAEVHGGSARGQFPIWRGYRP
jgi:hypothetical protein